MRWAVFGFIVATALAFGAQQLPLPIPGAIIVMALYATALIIWPNLGHPSLLSWANRALKHISLLFLPAGIWVLFQSNLLANTWLSLISIIVFSTICAQWLLVVIAKRVAK